MDDTFAVVSTAAQDELTEHLNSIDNNIKFTTEQPTDGELPFLDTNVCLHENGSTTIKVYCKPTHTDQYLNFKSNHHLEHKQSVVRTLLNRAEQLVTTEEDNQWNRTTFAQHSGRMTSQTGFYRSQLSNLGNYQQQNPQPRQSRVSIFHMYHRVSTYHKPINTIRSLLVHPKDKVPDDKKCGVVYKFTCATCKDTYVGETGRSLGIRTKDHLSNKTPLTAVGEHRQ